MVGIPKWSFKSIWRGKAVSSGPFMAPKLPPQLSESIPLTHFPAPQSPSSGSSLQTRLLVWPEEASFGHIWPGLVQSGGVQIQCLNIPKEWNLQAFQPVGSLLNTTLEDQKHRTPVSERPPLLRLPACRRLWSWAVFAQGSALKVSVDNLLPVVPKRMLISPLPFLQKVELKSNSHNENNFQKNV